MSDDCTDCTDCCQTIIERRPNRLARDLMDDLITEDNMPPLATPELLDWITSLGLDYNDIPAHGGMVIDPRTMTFYWREFARDAEGARIYRGDSGAKITRTKSMILDELPGWLQ